jgi:membrane associated rhomboid family serine protease
MLIPLRTDSPLRQTPYMNWAIIAANAIVYVITVTHPQVAGHYGLSPRQPLLYQFFTYQFLHGSLLHIVGNMLFLFIFGNNVNDRLGNLGYLAFYLAGGVFAGISYVILSGGDTPMVGASGAIAAVTGAYLVLLPRSNVTIVYFYFLVGTAEVASLWFILFFFLYDVYLNFTGHDQVAHTAHIGGTLFGFITCVGLLTLHLLPRDQFDVVALIQRWNKRRQYRDMVSKGYNPFEYTQADVARRGGKAPPPPDPRTSRIMDLRTAISEAVGAHNLDRAVDLYVELKTYDAQQVLPRQQQLDVANHLAAQQRYPQAAEAYEIFIQQYPRYEQLEHVELMLGLIYVRYLNQPDRARNYLTKAAAKIHSGRELDMARDELSRLGPGGPVTPPPQQGQWI